MTKTSKPILFFGNEKLATGVDTKAHIFQWLIEANYSIRALIISQKLDSKSDNLAVVKLAKENDIEIRSFDSLKNAQQEIINFGVQAAVLAAYGKIIPKDILELFKIGIINVHPSLLPKHRGPTPIESVILNGDSETGVSIMRLSQKMDSGPIYAQRSLKLTGKESKQELADLLDELGKDILSEKLDNILNSSLNPTQQPSDNATYDTLINKQDGVLDWKDPWRIIDRKIRAYSNWPTTKSRVANKEITILEAHAEQQTGPIGKFIEYNGYLAVYCQDSLVVIDKLIPNGKKPMSSKEFIVGYSKQIFS